MNPHSKAFRVWVLVVIIVPILFYCLCEREWPWTVVRNIWRMFDGDMSYDDGKSTSGWG